MQNRPVSLSDLTQDLLWPRLLRVPSLALAPGRMFLSLVGVVLIGLAFKTPGIWGQQNWSAEVAERSAAAQRQLGSAGGTLLEPGPWLAGWSGYLYEMPVALLREHPWASLVSFGLALVVLGVMGGAVARSAALEAATGVRPQTRAALGFALARWSSLAGSLLAPLVAVLLIGVGLAVAGWAALGIPWVKVAGASAYPVALLGGLLAVLLLLGYGLGWPMLTGAVASEGSDGLDAVVRVYAYVQARPLRLLVYLAILGAVLGLSGGVLTFVIERSIGLTSALTGAWLTERSAAVARGAAELDAPTSDKAAAGVVGFWIKSARLLGAAYVFSFFASGGSVLYLLMRRVADGQDVGEVWEPERAA
jgi:hypothetical protein